MKDSELIQQIIPLWYAQRKWGEELIERSFGIEKAELIMGSSFRKKKEIPGTNWQIRVHGVGVDIYRTTEVGGIDFDFDKPDPDEWRLRIFFEKQYNEGNLPLSEYRHLHEDEDLLKGAIHSALNTDIQTELDNA